MESKTIGKFITALRKANGMTQKDLAEKLNVSDKTISRWERDEGAPDLSMIPILAEIFDVTCDELLRGERKSPVEREQTKETEPLNTDTTKEDLSAKSEKQLKRLLKVSFSQFQNRTYIAIGLSVLGIIVALICNLAFLKAVLGGLLGAVFYAAGIVCQTIFHNRAYLSVEDAGLHEESLSTFKRNVIRLTQKSIGFTVACMGFTAHMLFMDAYVGINVDDMLHIGLIGTVIFLLVYAVILYFYNASLVKKGIYPLSEKERVAYHHNHKLLGRCALVLVLLLFITYNLQQGATSIADGFVPLVKGTTFEDYESFVAFAEQPIARRYDYRGNSYTIEQVVPNSTVYYDEYGNEISYNEAKHRTLEDKNGNVVCEYIERNENIRNISYSPKDGTVLPITVYTYDDYDRAFDIADTLKALFIPVYLLEIAVMAWIYLKKRIK